MEFILDMEVPDRLRPEAGDDSLLVPAVLQWLLKDNLCVTIRAEHSFEWNMGEYLLTANRTPEELEQHCTISVNYF